jgi:hypothetical protein
MIQIKGVALTVNEENRTLSQYTQQDATNANKNNNVRC